MVKQIFKGFLYLLTMMGSAFGGFPPPKLFAREETPEEVIERVVEDAEFQEQAEEAHWARRYERVIEGSPAEAAPTTQPETEALP